MTEIEIVEIDKKIDELSDLLADADEKLNNAEREYNRLNDEIGELVAIKRGNKRIADYIYNYDEKTKTWIKGEKVYDEKTKTWIKGEKVE